MKILLVGNGGREHALAWKMAQADEVDEIVAVPGSAGMEAVARCREGNPLDLPQIGMIAEEENPDLVVIGPEAPLAAGLADYLRRHRHTVFGPGTRGAQIESSKSFAKKLLQRHQIPTAEARIFDDVDKARSHAHNCRLPTVVKADGLAAGKGVILCHTRARAVEAVDQMMTHRHFGDAGCRILFEEFLTGEELSVFAITDGVTIVPLMACRDHKPLEDGDEGPNTGGMGSICPAPQQEQVDTVVRRILVPTIHALRSAEIEYRGLLYAGLMWTGNGPKVIEFNCRFGDPETQALLPMMKGSLPELMIGAATGELHKCQAPEWQAGSSVCVCLAAPGYPGSYRKGIPIEGLDRAGCHRNATIFHAGTNRTENGWETSGGRVLGIVCTGDDLDSARKDAYSVVEQVDFEGKQFRTDIGIRSATRVQGGIARRS